VYWLSGYGPIEVSSILVVVLSAEVHGWQNKLGVWVGDLFFSPNDISGLRRPKNIKFGTKVVSNTRMMYTHRFLDKSFFNCDKIYKKCQNRPKLANNKKRPFFFSTRTVVPCIRRNSICVEREWILHMLPQIMRSTEDPVTTVTSHVFLTLSRSSWEGVKIIRRASWRRDHYFRWSSTKKLTCSKTWLIIIYYTLGSTDPKGSKQRLKSKIRSGHFLSLGKLVKQNRNESLDHALEKSCAETAAILRPSSARIWSPTHSKDQASFTYRRLDA